MKVLKKKLFHQKTHGIRFKKVAFGQLGIFFAGSIVLSLAFFKINPEQHSKHFSLSKLFKQILTKNHKNANNAS